ncbi:MAG TPA: hypothetical protein VK789_18735 [Bryobacteraceae bacterium]|jgi:hypothetical protein|nr:hypothetical protein [Bryobacteraceae bacterium]
MASEPLVGGLLRTLAASKPGGHFLELGTGKYMSTNGNGDIAEGKLNSHRLKSRWDGLRLKVA